jgi:hypothetical protein
MRILTDDVETDPILDFERYSDAVINMVRDSNPKFVIGIYGEWGTGKTTLMRFIENKLRAYVKGEVVRWDNILDNGSSDSNRLKHFLKENFQANWIEYLQFVKGDDKTISVYDTNELMTIDSKGTFEFISKAKENTDSLSITLNDEKKLMQL